MKKVVETYIKHKTLQTLAKEIKNKNANIFLNSCVGSAFAFVIAGIDNMLKHTNHLIIMESKEEAAYLCNDLETLLEDENSDYETKHVVFYPALTNKKRENISINNDNAVLRLQILNRLNKGEKLIIVSYPEAIEEKVVTSKSLDERKIIIKQGQELSIDEKLSELDAYGFECVDFVVQAGQYAIRGGILDVFSFAQQLPYRIEMNGDKVESIRTFDIATQLSIEEKQSFIIIPDLEGESKDDNDSSFSKLKNKEKVSLFSYLDTESLIWARNLSVSLEKTSLYYEAEDMQKNYLNRGNIVDAIAQYTLIESGLKLSKTQSFNIDFSTVAQPSFNQDFSLFAENLQDFSLQGYDNMFFVRDEKQKLRIENIIKEYENEGKIIKVRFLDYSISSGFIDNDLKQTLFTDHQLFNRYNRYHIQDNADKKESITIDELLALKPGDYVTHIDYGIGRFSGLEKLNNNGREQEAIRLIYKNNDILYVSIHSLHKISRYTSNEGTEPKLNRLGSTTWQTLKERTKKKVKDIAKDLIRLYAQRKASKGFAFSADSYLQNTLEASFMYEDTPDQYKATKAVQVQSRIKQLERLERLEVDLEDTSRLRLKFPPAPRSGDYPVIAQDLMKTFGEHVVFHDVNFTIRRGEKVAFVGKNGEGKTTLVRCIMQQLDYYGTLKIGHNVKIGYFAQNQASLLDGELTVFDTIDRVATGDIRTRIRDILGAFMFGGEASDKKVKVLSGGERSRLAMIRLLLEPVNLLILDEPTNHLDMQSKDILKEALLAFDGTLIVVSHDRYFLEGLVSKVYEFGSGKVTEHLGGIYDFLKRKKISTLQELERKQPSVTTEYQQSVSQKSAKADFEQQKEQARAERKKQKQIAEIEQQITALEKEQQEIEQKLSLPENQTDTALFERYEHLKRTLEQKMYEWELVNEL